MRHSQDGGEDNVLSELLGRDVEVRSLRGQSECVDSGVLEAFDERWIKLRTDSDELLYFPIANVRLLKPTNP